MTFNGNETIDCYPSFKEEIKKILVVSEQTFKKLQKEFRLFFQGLKSRLSQRSSLLRPNRRQILRPQQPPKASGQKIGLRTPLRGFRDYEPTNAIYCNNSDWRRWVRVKEWFSQYGPESDDQKFQKMILIQ